MTWHLLMSLVSKIQAGDPLMLFNVQHEAFASVSGSFAYDTLPAKLQKAIGQTGSPEIIMVARSQCTAQGSQKLPPISGGTFWQFEKLSNPLSGKKVAKAQYPT